MSFEVVVATIGVDLERHRGFRVRRGPSFYLAMPLTPTT
jgi:hypothetical protein